MILALTADIQTKTRNECEAAGAAAVLSKPIRRQQLADTITRWLAFKQAAHDIPLDKADEDSAKVQTSLAWDQETANYEFGDAETALMVVHEMMDNARNLLRDVHAALATGDYELIANAPMR